MNKLFKIGIPIVFIVVIFIIFVILYYLGYIKFNLGEGFNTVTQSICKPLVLKNIQYDDTVDRNNLKKLYVLEKDNYYALIENNQPYGFFPDYKLDTDELNEVKVSSQYVWCLNMNRNQIRKAQYNKDENMNNLKYKNLFRENYTECSEPIDATNRKVCEKNADSILKYITAFGVCKDVNPKYEYCCVAVTDFSAISKSYILIIRGDYEKIIDLQETFIEDQNTYKKIYKKTEIMLTGNIIMEKDKIEENKIHFKLFCIENKDYKVGDNKFSHQTSIRQFDLKIPRGEELNPTIEKTDEILTTEDTYVKKEDNDLQQNKNDILREIEKIKIHLNSNPVYYEDSVAKKKKKNTKTHILNTELTRIKIFDNFKSFIEITQPTGKDTDPENITYIAKCYKLMNRIINFICSGNLKLGFYSIDKINNKYFIIKSSTQTQTQTTNYKIELLSIDKFNEANISELPLQQKEIKLGANFIENKEKCLQNIKEIRKTIDVKNDLTINKFSNTTFLYDSVEMLNNQNLKVQVKNFTNLTYYFNNINLDFDTNVVGILDFKPDTFKNQNNKMITNKITHPRKVLFFLHQKITSLENGDKENIYGRVINKSVIPIKYYLIPSIKFDYGKQFGNKNLSLLSYFFDNTSTNNDLDKTKFQNYFDWIKIYKSLKSTGNYYTNKFNQFQVNKSLMFQALENELVEDFLPKHKFILNEPGFENIFDNDNLKFPNFEIYSLDNSDLDLIDDKEVFMSPRVNNYDDFTVEDNLTDEGDVTKRDEVFYIGLDKLKFEDEDKLNVKEYNNQKYYYYKIIKEDKEIIDNLEVEDKETIDNLEAAKMKNKYIWRKKIINNFDEYKKLILGDTNSEKLDRIRLRGLFEIDNKFVDDYYIDFIEKIKNDNIKNLPLYEIEKFDKFLQEKKNVVIERVIETKIKGNNKRINPLGYPFHVIYKHVDVRGNICQGEEKDRQKIFLINTLHKEHIKNEALGDTYLDDIENLDKNYKYPFIKQEFFSFTGYGNLIQFSLTKKGGITSIEPKKICGSKDTSFTRGCNKQDLNTKGGDGCNTKKLGFANLDGTPRCEIVAKDVKKSSETSVETLVPHSVDVNACNIYINKGNHKIHYRLGRVFQNSGEKIQIKNTYTIQLTEGENKDKYLYYNKNGRKIEMKEKVNEDTNEIQNYWFVGILKNDIYGSYMLFNPQQDKTNYLTANVDLINHTIDEFTLQTEIKTDTAKNRNNLNDNYKNDRDYYSQKFVVPNALVRNMIANDGTSNEELLNYMNELEIRNRVIGSFGLDGITTGSTNYETELSPEEEAKIIEEELGNLRNYLNNLNTIFQQEQFDIEGLKESLKVIRKQIEERIPFIEKKLKNIKYIVSVSDKLKNRDMRLITENTIDSSKKKTSGNNKGLPMEQQFEQTESALEALQGIFNLQKQNARREQLRKNRKNSGKCNVVEGFDNQYSQQKNPYNNHVTDKYQEYLKNEVKNTKNELQKKHDKINNLLKRLSNVSKSVNYDSRHKDLLLSQVIDNNNKLDTDIREIKNKEQNHKIKQIQEKINQVKKLSCGIKKYEDKSEENSNYRSIISKHDGEPLTTYEFNSNRLNGNNKNNNKNNKFNNADNLKMNMILVNGGCLSFDQDKEKLNIEHCMIGNENQHFMINHIKSKEDLNEFRLDSSKGFDKSFSLVRQPLKNPAPIPSDPLCVKNQNDYCLHKENGEISIRECDNIKNHQWIYSNVSNSCN